MLCFGVAKSVLLMLQMHIHQRPHHPEWNTFGIAASLTTRTEPAILPGFHLQAVLDIERSLARPVIQMRTERRQASFLVFRVQP